MPIVLRSEELHKGMRLAEALVVRGQVMFAAGRELVAEDIDILKRRFPKAVMRIGDPVLDDVVDFEDDSHEREVANTVQSQIAGAMSEVRQRFAMRASFADLNFHVVHETVAQVIEYLRANPVTAVLLGKNLQSESYLADHAGNVFYLSMILGTVVREYVAAERNRQSMARELQSDHAMDLTPLALGSMLLDVGMLPLEELYKLERPLTEEEQKAVRQHPIVGATRLPENMSPLAKMVVRTHHENYDGSGYPGGLAKEKLHIFTRIVRIVDAYDAATASHVYQEAKTPARALWEMSAGPYRRCFDPMLMKVFARLIQPFPIGTKLRLADGRYAVVVRYNRKNSFMPHVIIAFDQNDNRLPNEQLIGPLNLEDHRGLRLDACGEEDLSYLHEANAALNDKEPPKERLLTSLFEAAFP